MISQGVGNFVDIDTDVEVATASLVITNHPLPGTLKATIRAHVNSEKEQLVILDEEIHRTQALLDEEIRRTQALLDKLRQQHTHRSTQLEHYQICLAPHRDLPSEVLSEIFLWSLAEWGVPVPRKDTDTPWNIIRVCFLWRQLALSMPMLWARVNLDLTVQYSPQEDHMMNRVAKVVIDASQNYPLSVRADFGSSFGSTASNLVARETIDLIFSNAHRLRGSPSCINPFFNPPAGIANSLEVVALHICGMTDIGPDLSFLKGSKKLREVTINSFSTPYSSIIQLPLRQPTALHKLHVPWSRLHPRAALSILRQCPSITSCTLSIGDIEDAFPDTAPCLLPELTHLALRLRKTAPQYAQCIEPLVLPRLTHLYLTSFYSIPPWPAACTQRVTQSGTLQLLELDAPISTPHLEELIRASPLLIELTVPRGAFSASCLEGVASGALLPRVQKLSCMVDTLDGFYAHLDMLQSRKLNSSRATHIAKMKFMTKSSRKASQYEGSARCREMRQSGRKISIGKYGQ